MSRAPLIDHIVWDWNGTIFGDSHALIDATIDAFAPCGMPPITRADYQRHHTQPITKFYERLAGRALTDHEQEQLGHCFHTAYAPHEQLVPLVTDAGITRFFTRIDGTTDRAIVRKAPHLLRHLRQQQIRPDRTLLIGDSVDDVLAAQECGTHCLIYHPGDEALHALDHFSNLGVPVMETLRAAVEHVLVGLAAKPRRASRRDDSIVPVVRPQPVSS